MQIYLPQLIKFMDYIDYTCLVFELVHYLVEQLFYTFYYG